MLDIFLKFFVITPIFRTYQSKALALIRNILLKRVEIKGDQELDICSKLPTDLVQQTLETAGSIVISRGDSVSRLPCKFNEYAVFDSICKIASPSLSNKNAVFIPPLITIIIKL